MNLRELATHPHRRLNPLTKEWVLVSPHRNERPWQGQVESIPIEEQPAYDPTAIYAREIRGREGLVIRNMKERSRSTMISQR